MNLRDLVSGQQLSRKEAFDILMSLAVLIENGVYSGISPENIEVKSNYEVTIKDTSVCDNAYFLAPEQLFYGGKASRNSAFFSFGMIYYYVLSSKIWYVAQSVKVYEIEKKEINIVDPGSPFADINKMVSGIPEERIKGFDAFFRQAQTLPKGMVFIKYVYDEQVIAEESFQADNDIDNYAADKRIKAPAGETYIVENSVSIISRFTDQYVSIPVRLFKSAGENSFEIRLQIDNDTENRIPLFELEGSKKAVKHPISLGRVRRISFWKTEVDSHGRVKEEKQLREFVMPRVKQEAFVCINYDSVDSKATVSLLNKNKSHRIVPKDISFNTDIE